MQEQVSSVLLKAAPAPECVVRERILMLALWLLVGGVATISAQQPNTRISGVVSDSSGAAIPDATVELQANGQSIRTSTDVAGNFSVLSAATSGTLLISSPGFSTVKIDLTSVNGPLQIRLDPAALIERIIVTPEDERIPATPTSQFAVTSREISVAGALTIDDVLRQVPGFSLFRRSGGLTANPTSQGVSLRGVGANGASRALVLLDGVPLNSPFGGWVYWNRIARTDIESVQVYNGATSDLYGSGALGGVINISSRTTPNTFLDLEASAGNKVTGATSFSGGKVFGEWGVLVSGQALRTGGYVLVRNNERGLVDTAAGTADLTGSITVSRTLGSAGHAFLRASSFGESRRNGTPVQLNDTRVSSIDLGTDWSNSTAGDLSLRLYGSSELFNQNFSAVAADRNSEALTRCAESNRKQISGR
jgi:outer membrane cobalamin receptor